MTPANVGTKASAINISETCLTDISAFSRFIWKPIDPVVPPSCTVSPSSIAGSTLRVERRCKSSWCNMKTIEQRGRRCEIDTGFCLRQLKTECFFTKSPSKALVVPVLWFSTWCFCQQILKQCLIRTENFICFGHFLLIVEGNLQQPHDLLALACIKIFSRVSSSRYFSSIPNSSMRFTRNKSWKMTKRTLSYQLSRCEVRAGKGPF